MSKKIEDKNQSAQYFMGVEAIQNRVLRTSRKYLFAFIQVQGRDNSLLNDDDNADVTDQLTLALAEQKEPWQILSIPRMVDISGMITELTDMIDHADNDPQVRLLSGEIEALEEMRRKGAREPILLVKIWRKAGDEAETELLRRAETIRSQLQQKNVSARLLDNDEILQVCRIYGDMNTWITKEQGAFDVPMLSGKKRKITNQGKLAEQQREQLRERITPVGGFFFEPNRLVAGGVCARCYGVTRYPAEVKYGWAVDLMNADDAITCITYTPGNPTEIGDALSRSISRERREAMGQHNAREQKSHQRKSQSADRLLDNLDGKGISLGQVSLVVMPFAPSQEQLEAVCRRVTARFAGRRLRLRVLTALQKQAYMHLSPYFPMQDEIEQMLQRICPLETLMGGYPMTSTVIRDDHGLHFAVTPDGRMITVDLRQRSTDRTNGNGVVTGLSGIGKSTMLKHLLMTRYMCGDHCIVFDPEREFREMCKNLGGSWWAAGGGGAKVNLFQITPIPPDDEEDDTYRADVRPVYQHIQQIKTILHYKIPSLEDIDMALIEDAILHMYAAFGIPEDANDALLRSLPPDKYPTMEDLYRILLDWEEKDKRYKSIAQRLKSMAEGADSEIWNGHTNISLDNRMVVIDTNQLYHSTKENQAAQYYNLLHMAFSKASEDQTTPYFILADEAQTLLDPELPQAAKALRNMSLRLRKREGCLWLAFHSLHELLDDRVRMDGQAILDTAAYKIIFGTSGQNLADTVELFQLTEAEKKVLKAQQQRKALCVIGARHIQAEFVIPDYKLELMGKGGGR